jgi:N-acetylglutamate synthase-like GNAT family acetyltransferase
VTGSPRSEAELRTAIRPRNAGQPTGVRISTDPQDLDLDWVYPALSDRAYWALGRSRDQVERSIRNSLCFGAYDADGRQVGIARVITDEATFAWICDVFVDESARGQGIGQALMAAIVADARLQGLRRMVLATRDAETLYARFGFEPLRNSSRWMERRQPGDVG